MIRTLLSLTSAAVFAAVGFAGDSATAEKDGKIAKKLVAQLESRHVSHQRFDDSLSQRAWTNLVTIYDAEHYYFLKSDIEELSKHEFTLDDELKSGDVSFGYKVYDLFCKRISERVDFATNLLAKGEWDFSKDESYIFKRDKEAWPADKEAADEIWRLKMKNEVLAFMLGREIDEEAAAKKKSDGEDNEKDAENDSEKKEDELPPEPVLTPEESLIKRYKTLAMTLTQSDGEMVMQTYMSAVCRAFDPHTDYFSPVTKEDFDMGMNLKLCGVGAVLSMDDGMIKIVEIMPGGPIDVDGRIKLGDKIVGVKQEDGEMEDIVWKPLNKTVHKIRGKKGTKVTLEIVPRSDPSGASRKKIELVRDEIKLDDQRTTGRVERVSIDSKELDIGYIYVPEFYGSMDRRPGDEGYVSCAGDVLEYIKKFNAEDVSGLILDLRGNGGGSLPEAIRMSSLFVADGPVVIVRDGRMAMPLQIDRGNTPAFRKPVIVLIDRGSASASEIVAGHLRDVGRAIVLGDVRTHGKGTVQSVMVLGREDQGLGSSKITTMRFYRINGRSTQVKGVASDIHLPSFLDSLDIGEEKLPYALPFTKIRSLNYRQAWNLPDYSAKLAELSSERTSKNEKFVSHMKNVRDFQELFERRTVPLERTKRKEQMIADRRIREIEDGMLDEENGEDEKTETSSSRRRKRMRRLNDVVLAEAFNVMADLVMLTGGADMPQAPIDWYNAILGY